MWGVREKLSLGFGGLLLIMVVIGVQSIRQLNTLGHSIDVILRENYRSVMACQQMKESLDRLDSGILITLLDDGYAEQGRELLARHVPIFTEALRIELANVTLPGEAERASRIKELFSGYEVQLRNAVDPSRPLDQRRGIYFEKLLPLFQEIKTTADEILQMNQQNMIDANGRARSTAAAARERMIVLLVSGALMAALFIIYTEWRVLRPIQRLTRSADEISRGNLDLVVRIDSRDEIGRLSEAFNEMASSLREFRRSDLSRLARIQRSTQQVFRSLPNAVAVVDLDGRVEVSTEAAAEIFGLKSDVHIRSLAFDWLAPLFDEALKAGRIADSEGKRPVIQRFVTNEERFFRPRAFPILDRGKRATGVILLLEDVTRELQQDELKRGVISTVSHQLKTPLTSLRMAIYLLLEEKAGLLTPKQMELLVAAREDSDRLHSILSSLLDISRIESGKMRMDLKPIDPHAIVLEQVDGFRSAARDRGIDLQVELSDEIPRVMADPPQIAHVLANGISNALNYTTPGGTVTVSVRAGEETVCFTVKDTGAGIPAEHLDRVFEQFFRVPGQESSTGEGLGLAIAREIVEAHGGTIKVESREGEGTTLTFCLMRAGRATEKG
jgi:signal transduction histidine kinase